MPNIPTVQKMVVLFYEKEIAYLKMDYLNYILIDKCRIENY